MDEGISIEDKQDAILLYSSGELESEQIAEVEAWLSESEELRAFYQSMGEVQAFVLDSKEEQEFECVRDEVMLKLEKPKKLLWFPVVGTAIAASITLMFWLQFSADRPSASNGGGEEVTDLTPEPKADTTNTLNRFRKINVETKSCESGRNKPNRFSKRRVAKFVHNKLKHSKQL